MMGDVTYNYCNRTITIHIATNIILGTKVNDTRRKGLISED